MISRSTATRWTGCSNKIASLDTRRLVATNPANFTRLEVDDEEFRRKIISKAKMRAPNSYLAAAAAPTPSMFGEPVKTMYTWASDSTPGSFSTQISTWVDASYVSVAQDDVLAITVENSEGQFTFVRAGDSLTYADLGEDEVLEDTKLPIILRNAATIRLLEPLGLGSAGGI